MAEFYALPSIGTLPNIKVTPTKFHQMPRFNAGKKNLSFNAGIDTVNTPSIRVDHIVVTRHLMNMMYIPKCGARTEIAGI
jgi:hypothetical protein